MSSPSKIGKDKNTDGLVPLSMVSGRHFLLVFLLFLLLFIGMLGTTVNLGNQNEIQKTCSDIGSNLIEPLSSPVPQGTGEAFTGKLLRILLGAITF